MLAILGFVTNGPGPSSLVGQILNVVSPLPLFLALGWAGYELWSGKALASEVGARSVAAQPAQLLLRLEKFAESITTCKSRR